MKAPCVLAAALCLATVPHAVQASDRPFLATSTAAAEDDDDQVWSVETWWQRAGSQHSFHVAPEYAFNPTTSIQLEAARGSDGSQGLELDFKRLFNHIGRDGWGWGMTLSLGAGRTGSSGWRAKELAFKLPWSLNVRDGEAQLHVNAGLLKERGERREWVVSAAFEHKLASRTSAFVELAREDRQTLWHVGARHWIRHEKLALDFSVQHLREGADQASGVVIGLAWHDL
ncbi:hypothetical protein BURC_02946 [Burkholderiaceae bacterium]|nr:hypothetical protein BURC_02946 [Burkholderiaceae bacterium]